MKKFFGIISILLVCILLVGCGANDNNSQVKLATQKISSSLDKIIAQVKKMDEIKSSDIDLSNDLGYYKYDDSFNTDNTYNSLKNGRFSTPTRNNGIRHNSMRPTSSQQNKRFYFVSREAEESYGDLYMVSCECANINNDYNTSKENLINNCIQVKTLLQKLNDSKINVNEADLKTLNSYYDVIKSCLDNLSNSSSCQGCVKTISNKKANLAGNSSSMMADYIRLCNTLDQNCLSCENANNSIREFTRYLLNLLGETDIDNNTFNSRYTRNARNYNYRNYNIDYNENNYRNYNVDKDNYRRYETSPNYNEDNRIYSYDRSINYNDQNIKSIDDNYNRLPSETETISNEENSYVFRDNYIRTNEERPVNPHYLNENIQNNTQNNQNDNNRNFDNNNENITDRNIISNDNNKDININNENNDNYSKVNNNNIANNDMINNADNQNNNKLNNNNNSNNSDLNNNSINNNYNSTNNENVNSNNDNVNNLKKERNRNIRNINDSRRMQPRNNTYRKYIRPRTSNIGSIESQVNNLAKINDCLLCGPKNVRA